MKYLIFILLIIYPLTAQYQYPLGVGTKWQYMSEDNRTGQPVYKYAWTEWVDHDTVMLSGLKYAYVKRDIGGYRLMRQGGTKVFEYVNKDSDRVKYDFSKNANDTIEFIPFSDDTLYCTITSVSYITILSQYKRSQWYQYTYVHRTEPQYYQITDGFGITSIITGPTFPIRLTGAIIDGYVYGTITSTDITENVPPSSFILEQNYPNPFNSTTTIKFTLPKKEYVSLRIFNMLGQQVSSLAEGELSMGTHVHHWNASDMSSGLYYYSIRTSSNTKTKIMLHVK